MGINSAQLKSIAQLASAKGFKCFGKLNGKQAIETIFRNADGVQMKVVKDATTGKAISRTTSNEFGSFTKTYLGNGYGQVEWNELFKTADGTVLKDINRQTILHEGRNAIHNGKIVKTWSATQVFNTIKEAFLDKAGRLVGYDSRYALRNYESLEPGNANIREMLPSLTKASVNNHRGITLAGKEPMYKPGMIWGNKDGYKTQLAEHYDDVTQLQDVVGPLHQWATLF